MHLDLQAFRCPTAQQYAMKALTLYAGTDGVEMVIVTVEPSLGRDIRHRIAHLGLPFDLQLCPDRPITDEIRASWSERFDEEDYSDVEVQRVFKLVRVVKEVGL